MPAYQVNLAIPHYSQELNKSNMTRWRSLCLVYCTNKFNSTMIKVNIYLWMELRAIEEECWCLR